MKRSIRVRMNFVVDIDDAGSGIPRPFQFNVTLARVAKAVFPEAVYLHPGGRFDVGLTRESINELRRARRAAK